MQSGQHTWKMKVESTHFHDYHMLGIAAKPLSAERANDYTRAAYGWFDGSSIYIRDGVQRDGPHFCSLTSTNLSVTFQLDLDCNRHVLKITNLQSGETSTLSNLPQKEYFQFANLRAKGNLTSVEFVE